MSHLYGLGAGAAGLGLNSTAIKMPPASAGATKGRAKYKKAPGAPKRFKSAFIFFSTAKHKEIRKVLGEKGKDTEKTTNVAKLVSEAWRELPPDERKKWEDMAKEDRARYEEERRTYRGPWKVAVSKKPYKDPNAPKRPMSAFLMYSNGRRAAVKKENPDFSNGEISRLLSEMWRKASEEDRQKYIKEEFELRTKYKEDMAKWKKEAEEKEKELVAKQAEEELNNPPPHREALAGLTNYSAMLASNPAAATSYLAAMAGAGSGASQFEELAMQRARSQLEAEQRARMLAQLGGAGMDAGADMYSRYAVAAAAAGGGYPSAGGFGQYPDMLGAASDPYARQLRQEQELRQQQQLLALQEQDHQATMAMYAQQQQQQQQGSFYGGGQDQQSAAAMLDSYGRTFDNNNMVDGGYGQQQQNSALESQLAAAAAAGYGNGGYQAEMLRQAFDPRGRGGGFVRSP